MTKKALFFLMVMLILPNIASALNYWSVSASTSPVIAGAITPPSGPGYVTSGSVTNITSPTITTADFLVNPAPTGYALSYVLIDGVRYNAPNFGAYYRVNKGTRVNHTISAFYAAVKYTITTSKTGNGYIDPTVQVVAGTNKTITMTPSVGYRIASVANGGATLTDGDGVSYAAYTFTNVQSNKSISVTFEPIPVVDAQITTPAQSIVEGSSLLIDGSTSTSSVPPTYTWSVTPAGATLTPAADGRTATFSATAMATYTITLELSAAGAAPDTASVNISVISRTALESGLCIDCHNDRSPAIVGAYNASKHANVGGVSCQGCHNPDGTIPHYYYLSPDTVSRTTFIVLGAGAGTVGQSFCANCHSSAEIAQSAAHATVNCATCHNNVHNPDIAGAGVNATYCATCHGVTAVAIPPLSAGHSNNCSGCHGSVAHNPHTTDGLAPDPCFDCHNQPNSAHYYLVDTAVMTAASCSGCHSGHNHDPQLKAGVVVEHFNGYTSYANPNYAAAYVTPVTACANCHKGGDATSLEDNLIEQYRKDWAASGHGDIKRGSWLNSASHNWKATGLAGAKVRDLGFSPGTSDCLRCHTATGYVQFSNLSSIAPITTAAARYSEPLTCNACHNADFTARSVTPRTGYYNYSSLQTGKLLLSAALPDSRTSNICVGCHTGHAAGDTIRAMAAATAHKSYSSSFWQDVAFVNSHYMSAAGQLFGVTGYEYPGQEYASPVDHSKVGASAAGPCVTCHMAGQKHAKDVSVTNYSQCDGCHGGTVTQAFLDERMARFDAALAALGSALTQRGFTPNLVDGVFSYPYFSTRNWGNKDLGPGNMGAAFNYNLLKHDRGAFAHNPTYVKRLLRDSIDFLTSGGTVDRSRDLSATVNALLSDPVQRADANAFLEGSESAGASCEICHSETLDPSSGIKILVSYNGSKHATASGGASCGSCHSPDQNAGHPPQAMLSDTVEISGKCQGCHGPHPWNSVGRCVECHNGHEPKLVEVGYPHFSTYSTAQYAAGTLNCHDCHNQAGSTVFRFYPAHAEWADSGHGDPLSTSYIGPEPYSEENLAAYDFKLLGTPLPSKPANSASQDCVRCHTSTGYVNYVTPTDPEDPSTAFSNIAPWGNPADRSREMVSCPACHTPTPFDAGFGRRSVGILEEVNYTTVVRAWYNYSSAATRRIVRSKIFVNPVSDMVDSNICITCHSGRVGGDIIRQASNCTNLPSIACRLGSGVAANGLTGSFWGQVDFIDPHGSAASIVFPDNLRPGYEYRPSAFNASHMNVGNYTSQGPCVGCHMSSAKKHSFSVLSSATTGVISGVSTSVCLGCHNGGAFPVMDAARLESKRAPYQEALALIKDLLALKGIHYNAAKSPYFFSEQDPALQNSATRTVNWNYDATYQGAHLMGAAFNLRLLDSDAAWVHNGTYARRLLYDTIDYLDDGVLNANVVVETQSLHDYLIPRP